MLRATLAARIVCPTSLLLGANKGKVVSWNASRGFGFVENDADKKQVFVHQSSIVVENQGFRALTPGQDVEFDVNPADDRGRVSATNVTSIGGAPLPAGQRPPQQEGGFRGGRGGGYGRGGRGGGGFRGGRGGRGGQQQNDFNDGY
jgi:cold shock CspA family protein